MPRIEVFRATRAYHAAVADYWRALANREDLEHAAQQVLGTSLRYRVAIDGVMTSTSDHRRNRQRLRALRTQLDCLSQQYNTMKRTHSNVVR
jgi:hypothetical protein